MWVQQLWGSALFKTRKTEQWQLMLRSSRRSTLMRETRSSLISHFLLDQQLGLQPSQETDSNESSRLLRCSHELKHRKLYNFPAPSIDRPPSCARVLPGCNVLAPKDWNALKGLFISKDWSPEPLYCCRSNAKESSITEIKERPSSTNTVTRTWTTTLPWKLCLPT